ncbi:MAG: hypothetical protein ACE5G1_10685 [bacterium]
MAIDGNLLVETKEAFQVRKILTIGQVAGHLQSALVTARRFLKASRALTSYNQKGRFYTLPEIPKFDGNGIWRYKEACFAKHGNLKSTIVYLVTHSPIGLSAREIGEVVGLDPTSFMHHFRDISGIRREKYEGRFIYFSENSETYDDQIRKRKRVQKQLTAMLTDTDAVLILVKYIKHPGISIEEVVEVVSKTGKRIDASVVTQFLEFHDLLKKTPGTPL